jgi:hypothetical protein
VFTIPDNFPVALAPLAWLVGTWSGEGVGGYPTVETFRFAQEIEVTNDGRPFLSYASRSWILDDAGERVRPAGTETGFWRPAQAPSDASKSPARSPSQRNGDAPMPTLDVDLLLTHPTGFIEIWTGQVEGPRIALQTDVVARTPTAKEYSAGTRVYGLVESDLMWAFDMAAVGQSLQPHLSARLSRVEADR